MPQEVIDKISRSIEENDGQSISTLIPLLIAILIYLLPALAAGVIERTIPEKPQSRLQRYRLTEKGRAWPAAQTKSKKA